MVLINEVKYACQACIKGHRSSGCTHTERPLFEIKKKGRPTTQCNDCRELRKVKQVHVRCVCAAGPQNVAIGSSTPSGSTSGAEADGSMAEDEDGAVEPKAKAKAKKKKKSPTDERPAFPNGLKDYNEMKEAAEALDGLLGSASGPTNLKTSLDSLLNPCLCKAGGACNCCRPRKSNSKQPPSDDKLASPPVQSPASFQPFAFDESYNSASDDPSHDLSSYFPTQSPSLSASLRDAPPSLVASSSASSRSSSPFPSSSMLPPTSTIPLSQSIRRKASASTHSPHDTHHTSPFVHKTTLYSPYAKHGGEARSSARSTPTSLPSPRDILASTANRNLRELVGNYVKAKEKKAKGKSLPSFDKLLAGDGETQIAQELGLQEDVIVMSGCTCGENCTCPSCVEHGNAPMDGLEAGDHVDCPSSCSSCFGCTKKFTVPSNINTIEALISATASSLPEPPSVRQNQFRLDGTNVTILSTSTLWGRSKEGREAFGLRTDLPKLECCSGNCRCFPNECTCMKDCCGCCGDCGCAEDGKSREKEDEQGEGKGRAEPAKSCCSTQPVKVPAPPPAASSCCSSGTEASRPTSPSSSSFVHHPKAAASESSSCCSTRSPSAVASSLDPAPTNPSPSNSTSTTTLSQARPTPPLLSRSSSTKSATTTKKTCRKTTKNSSVVGNQEAHAVKSHPLPAKQHPPKKPSLSRSHPPPTPPNEPAQWIQQPVLHPYPYPYPSPYFNPYANPHQFPFHPPQPGPYPPFQNGYPSSDALPLTSPTEYPRPAPVWPQPPQGYPIPYYDPRQPLPPPYLVHPPDLDPAYHQQAYLAFLATQNYPRPPPPPAPHQSSQNAAHLHTPHAPPSTDYAQHLSQNDLSPVDFSSEAFESFLASLPSPAPQSLPSTFPTKSHGEDEVPPFLPDNDLLESLLSQPMQSGRALPHHVEPSFSSSDPDMASFEFERSPRSSWLNSSGAFDSSAIDSAATTEAFDTATANQSDELLFPASASDFLLVDSPRPQALRPAPTYSNDFGPAYSEGESTGLEGGDDEFARMLADILGDAGGGLDGGETSTAVEDQEDLFSFLNEPDLSLAA